MSRHAIKANLISTIFAGLNTIAGQTIHLVLGATDNGKPSLARYQRVVVIVIK